MPVAPFSTNLSQYVVHAVPTPGSDPAVDVCASIDI